VGKPARFGFAKLLTFLGRRWEEEYERVDPANVEDYLSRFGLALKKDAGLPKDEIEIMLRNTEFDLRQDIKALVEEYGISGNKAFYGISENQAFKEMLYAVYGYPESAARSAYNSLWDLCFGDLLLLRIVSYIGFSYCLLVQTGLWLGIGAASLHESVTEVVVLGWVGVLYGMYRLTPRRALLGPSLLSPVHLSSLSVFCVFAIRSILVMFVLFFIGVWVVSLHHLLRVSEMYALFRLLLPFVLVFSGMIVVSHAVQSPIFRPVQRLLARIQVALEEGGSVQ